MSSKQTEALKLALEALEETRNALAWFYDSYPQDVTQRGSKLLPHVETVLTAIREALAEQPAQQEFICSTGLCHYKAQQQEPVATVIQFDGEKIIDASMEFFDKYPIGTELYTSPPASKPWVELTQDELSMIGDRMRTWNSHSLVDVYTAIEAKLREKNQ